MPMPILSAPDGGQTAALAVRLNNTVADYCKEVGAEDVDVRLLVNACGVILTAYLSQVDAFTAFQLQMHLTLTLSRAVKSESEVAADEALHGAKSS